MNDLFCGNDCSDLFGDGGSCLVSDYGSFFLSESIVFIHLCGEVELDFLGDGVPDLIFS